MPTDSAKPRPLSQAILLLIAVTGPAIGGITGLAVAITYSDTLREGGALTALTLIAIGLIGCGFWVLPTHLLSLVCGWAMGLWTGAAVALITATLAAPAGYWVASKIIGDNALQWVNRYPKGATACRAISNTTKPRAGLLVALLRVSPVVPYGATNVLAAIFRIPRKIFIAGTLIGLAPRVFAVAALGAGLESLEQSSNNASTLAALSVIATFVLIAVLGWITRIALNQSLSPVLTQPSNAKAS